MIQKLTRKLSLISYWTIAVISITKRINLSPYKPISRELSTCDFPIQRIPRREWLPQAIDHQRRMTELLYPSDHTSMKQCQHAVHNHPVYNFLHTYYRYAVVKVMQYSPGLNAVLQQAHHLDFSTVLSSDYELQDDQAILSLNKLTKNDKKIQQLQFNYDVLLKTSMRSPHFACFGFHEWAMLYSGSSIDSKPLEKHQPQLELRVSQDVIDEVVESHTLKCTHFDAWRFFHPDAKILNNYQNMSRSLQSEFDQPGCIHVTMDLFRYAYQIYPFIPSSILQDCLQVALQARIIDVRASPYDASMYSMCKTPIKVETMEGRKEYMREQENLYNQSENVRFALISGYKNVLDMISHSS